MSHGSMGSKESGLSGGLAARQFKQAAFMQKVQQTAKEERANHLRWYVCTYVRMCTCS